VVFEVKYFDDILVSLMQEINIPIECFLCNLFTLLVTEILCSGGVPRDGKRGEIEEKSERRESIITSRGG